MAELFITLTFLCIVVVRSYPVENPTQSLEYLSRFGYLSPHVKEAVELRQNNAMVKVREGLKNFQYFAGIPRTGVLDQTTIDHMNLPRCGNSELEKGTKIRRRRRFVLDSKWEKVFLTYRIINLPSDGPNRTMVEHIVRKAFAFWSEVANIHVQPTRSPAEKPDIEISFVQGKHNDGIEFDVIEGVGRVVAHAWKPFNADPLRGDMHFNDEVSWDIGGSGSLGITTVNENVSYDFLRTAIHEAGHALGLEHSPHPEALMYFAVTGHRDELKLSKDDKQGIQELYGQKLGSGAFLDPRLTWKKTDNSGSLRPIVVPSGTPIQNVPWECYRFQEQNPKDAKGIRNCYQQFYRDFYLTQG